MHSWLPLLALLAASAVAAAPRAPRVEPSGWPGADWVAPKLTAIHAAQPEHGARLAAISALFVGMPYASSPLGEGNGAPVDPDPPGRFDRFDCVTFVEEVMALGWHARLDEAAGALARIRYRDGEVRYGARNHLMIAQWIPENVRAGLVRDVTRELGGQGVELAALDLDERDFVSAEGGRLGLDPTDRPVGHHEVPVVPVGQVDRIVDRVAHGTIISTVRTRRPGVPYRVTHVGLVLRVGGLLVVRHAHQGRGRVVEEALASYLASARRAQRWPIVGFNLLRIAPAPPP